MADRTKPCTCMCRIIIRFGGKSQAAMSCFMDREHLARILRHRVCRSRDYAWAIDSGWASPEEHTSELQSLMRISYAVFCLKNTNTHYTSDTHCPDYLYYNPTKQTPKY